MKDKCKQETWTVVTFDMCSSSNVIEDLKLTDNTYQLCFSLIRLNNFINGQAERFGMIPYKFVGDGWILLFPPEVAGEAILDFLARLSGQFATLSRTRIIRHLEHKPTPWGLTFGIDYGELTRIQMSHGCEYVGRALNIACRLQNAIKDRDKAPAYKVLTSRRFYERDRTALDAHKPMHTTRKLRNIRGSGTFRCVKFTLELPE